MTNIKTLLESAGYPDFTIEEDGFPHPGEVIRYYRKKLSYTDPRTGKPRSWTQKDLSLRLKISEEAVRHMENYKKGLDSISRRKMVADVLGIPLLLLGLGSTEGLARFLTSQSTTPPGKALIGPEHIQFYTATVQTLQKQHLTWTVQDNLAVLHSYASSITNDIKNANAKQIKQLQYPLFDLYELMAKIYSDDISNFTQAHWVGKKALSIAETLDDPTLKAVALNRIAYIHFAEHNLEAAHQAIDGASIYSPKANSPLLHSSILTTAALAYALIRGSETDRTHVQHLLEQGRSAARNADDEGYFSSAKYLTHEVEALLALKRPKTALGVINEVRAVIDLSQVRRIAFIDILEAEARILQKKWDIATTLLKDALTVSIAVRSDFQVNYINRLYATIRETTYGNAPDVLDLGRSLRRWQDTRNTQVASL